MAILTGGQVISEEVGLKVDAVTLDMLGEARKIVVSKDETTIIEGAGDEAEVARLIEKGVDDLDWRRADARYYRGWTPLFAAVSAGSADCTRFLLGALADVDCVTAAGSTPLIEAAARGHPGVGSYDPCPV